MWLAFDAEPSGSRSAPAPQGASPGDEPETERDGIDVGWYRALVESGSDAVVCVDHLMQIRVWNDAAKAMFGYDDSEILGRPLTEIVPMWRRDKVVAQINDEANWLSGRTDWSTSQTRYGVHRDGHRVSVEMTVARVERDGEWMLMASIRDTTELRRVESALEAQHGMLSSIMKAIPDGVLRVSSEGIFLEFVGAGNIGLPGRTGMVGKSFEELFPPALAKRCRDGLRVVLETDEPMTLIFTESELGLEGDRRFEARYVRLSLDEVVTVIRDVTERELATERLQYQALHDSLTGLPNRAFLERRLADHLGNDSPHAHDVAVLLLDLDQFKHVNDTYGHSTGDDLLIAVGERLLGAARAEDLVARLGGDEFVILIESDDANRAGLAAAKRVADSLVEPIMLGTRLTSVTTSIGVASSESPHRDKPGDLLAKADAAMYEAKAQGRNQVKTYDSDLNKAIQRRTLVGAALQSDAPAELELWYQPVFHIANHERVGFEALLRWTSETLGVISPAEFIPIAEDRGMISDIGAWVLHEACRQAARWCATDPSFKWLSINISANQLSTPDFAETVLEAASACGLHPSLLCVEVTETALMKHPDIAFRQLAVLREAGLGLAIDDFGTGYASLTFLRDLPITQVKIDRSFISGLPDTREDLLIVESTIRLAQGLGCVVIAEGVETEAQLETLRDLGCDKAQGYLLGRPHRSEFWTPQSATRFSRTS